MPDLFTTSDLPRRSVTTQLRRTVSREISVEFDVTDDIYRESYDDLTRRKFRPTSVAVMINLDTCAYRVTLRGPYYFDGLPGGGGTGQNVVTSGRDQHYLDVDTDHPGLITDAVVDCLAAHGMVKE